MSFSRAFAQHWGGAPTFSRSDRSEVIGDPVVPIYRYHRGLMG